MSPKENKIYLFDHDTEEFVGTLGPGGGNIDDIEEVCPQYETGTVTITEIRWPDYHTIRLYISGEKLDPVEDDESAGVYNGNI